MIKYIQQKQQLQQQLKQRQQTLSNELQLQFIWLDLQFIWLTQKLQLILLKTVTGPSTPLQQTVQLPTLEVDQVCETDFGPSSSSLKGDIPAPGLS